ncbi:MAG TPA: hypothetical protein VHC48_05585 [Puia sp.]|nr:hypothetical protein [Puia sp.]
MPLPTGKPVIFVPTEGRPASGRRITDSEVHIAKKKISLLSMPGSI